MSNRTAPGHAAALVLAVAALLVAAPAAAQQPCGGAYTVRPGDTLAGIAARCGVTIPALIAVNTGIGDDQDLVAGGSLRMPAPGFQPSPVAACGGIYTLRPGDTVAEIAAKCGLTVPILMAANPGLANPDNLVAGTPVRIVDVPRAGTAGPPIIVMSAPPTAAAVADSTAAADSAAAVPFLRFEGVLTQGEQCLLLRADDGGTVGLVGPPARGFAPGDRVVVTGPEAQDADCGTERTLEVRILWKRQRE